MKEVNKGESIHSLLSILDVLTVSVQSYLVIASMIYVLYS